MNSSEPFSKVVIYLACRDLINADWFSKSDPIILVKEFKPELNKWIEIGRTEKLMDNLNPTFSENIEVDYYFERVQKLKFEVFDVDLHSGKFIERNGDFLGEHTASLAQLIRSSETWERLKTPDGNLMSKGAIQIFVREVQTFRKKFEFNFTATNLPKHGLISHKYPSTQLIMQSSYRSSNWRTIYKSKPVLKSVSPKFEPFCVKMYKLTDKLENVEEKIRICICDHKNSLKEYGSAIVTIAEFLEAADLNSSKSWKIGNSSKGSSFLILNSCSVRQIFTFFEYIQDGFELSFAVAIDFTASNGDPKDFNSLHYLGNHRIENDYTRAINLIGSVVQEYDTDKYFPVLGFGAKLPPDYSFVSHDFAVNFNSANPNCYKVGGILDAYRKCLPYLQLYGPTNFSPIIRHVSYMAKSIPIESKNYFILLILTDGIITDMNDTINAIIEASNLPMSIIIIGIGNADFEEMVILDGDDKLLSSSNGRFVAKRDIVQFVPFNEYREPLQSLAKVVLEELPDQVTQYYESHGIFPTKILN